MSSLLHSVKVRRLIKANRKRVFAAFSNAEALAQWFSPSVDIAIDVQVFEFVPKGQFRVRYTMPDGNQPIVGGVYEVIDEPNQIVFTWVWEAPDPHADIPTRVFVEFIDRGEETEVLLTHDKLPKEACERHIAGWESTFDRIVLYLSATEARP
ncbi:SRPBCC family protein [Agaribacter marinus]|uniref:Activator of Hsp90 ATPase homologue 1/2-like C-terminal domain-containing protein n=1 Tax=Agaribacter marinus TaxID=1431249 RepID=A0AA37SVA4_9ALTE|nr:SRPBCC domain-containing protein [Agaribacter marinus]GLR69772.1 hypothetical protein GCM10007852_06800 [Agaribacter marinus]